ncbi:MAG TPA: hypothetical protein VG965_01610 [Patescibacteria group bacterium]|nr:hypothetical protein [Patescibacteria group bacterium]
MKQKILILLLTILFIFVNASQVFAKNVQVVGNAGGDGGVALGSKITFTDASTHKVVLTQSLDPSGNYTVSIPTGTYDVTVIPPKETGQSPTTRYNQKFSDANSVANVNVQSAPNSNPFQQANNNQTISYVEIGGLILFAAAVLSYFILRSKKK